MIAEATRPAALADLEDTFAVYKAPNEIRTVCGLHGAQNAASCPECDKHFPADVIEARKIGAAAPSGIPAGFVALADVQKMIREAIREERAFQTWQKEEQAKQAVAEAEAKAAAAKAAAPAPADPTQA